MRMGENKFELENCGILILIICFRDDSSAEQRLRRVKFQDEIDIRFGFNRHRDPVERLGWLINMHPVCKLAQSFLDISCS